MIQTLSIRELENKADNIYEAIIVLAKRARQINAEQKQQLMREKEYDDDYDPYVEEEIELTFDTDYEELPKPSTIALEEFLQGKVNFDYAPKEEELVDSEE